MDATDVRPHGITVTPRLLALLDERERRIAADRRVGHGKTLEQVLDDVFGPDDEE